MKNFLIIFILLYSSTFATPKYIFYFIGDGLGASQRQITEYYKYQVLGNKSKLAMNSLPISGITTTHSKSSLITDSAAAGTALATGYKTNNGIISKSPEGKNLKSLIKIAQEQKMGTGIITTTRVTHATPAVFVSHNINRANEEEIALNIINSGVDFVAGGGYKYFLNRSDNLNLEKKLIEKNYNCFFTEKSINNFKNFTGSGKVFASFTPSHLPYELDRKSDNLPTPTLAEMTSVGIETLRKNPNGFFMMIEGGRIDHAAHAQDPTGVINEVLGFDEAIKKALDFYKQHPNETLILVVADHETGGMGLGFGENYFMKLSTLKNVSYSIDDKLQKIYTGDKTAFYNFISKHMGLTNLTTTEKKEIEESFNVKSDKEKYGSYKPTAIAVAHILSKRSGIYWTTFAHTGTQVPLSAIGYNSKNFAGFKDNTEVAKLLAKTMGSTL